MSYLGRLKAKLATDLDRDRAGPFPETHLPDEPSKLTKGAFDGFDGDGGKGFPPNEAIPDAVALASVRNSPALYEPQADPNRCHVCGEREGLHNPFIPVLTPLPGQRHWLHRACHAEHSARMAAKAEAVVRTGLFQP